MRFLDFFSGIGGFRRGMELAGHTCVGFCENDKYAVAAYISMHLLTDSERERLSMLPLAQRQKEVRNGLSEWYSNDIRNVDAGSLPKAECWCFGAPCQSFSISRDQKGLDGKSGLVMEIFRLLMETGGAENRPEWLLYENVKGMFSSTKGFDFLAILLELDALGYDCEWNLINSKDYGVPQNRERVYLIGHLRRFGSKQVFSQHGTVEKNRVPLVQVGRCISKRLNPNRYRVYDPAGLAPTLTCAEGGGREPYIITEPHGETALYKGSEVSVRKLTPKECFRLQGWDDKYYERARLVASDHQLYKMAGNGVTVNVIYEIGRALDEIS